MPVTCQRCGAQNADHSKFCLSCGNDLRPMGAGAPPPAPGGFGPPPPAPGGFGPPGGPPPAPGGFGPPPPAPGGFGPPGGPPPAPGGFGPPPPAPGGPGGFGPPGGPPPAPGGFGPPPGGPGKFGPPPPAPGGFGPPGPPPPAPGGFGPPPPAPGGPGGFGPPPPAPGGGFGPPPSPPSGGGFGPPPAPSPGGPGAPPPPAAAPSPPASPSVAGAQPAGDLSTYVDGLRLIAMELRGIAASKTVLSSQILPSPLPGVAAVSIRYGRSMHVICAGGPFKDAIWPSRDFADRDRLLAATIGNNAPPEQMIPWVLTYVLPGVYPDLAKDAQGQQSFVEAADAFGVGVDQAGIDAARRQGFPDVKQGHARFLVVSEPKQSIAGIELRWGDRPFEMLYVPTPGVVARSAPWT